MQPPFFQMLVKCVSFIVVILLLSATSKAQLSLGLEAGISSNTLNSNAGTGITPIAKTGYFAGLNLQLPFNKWLSVEAVPSIIQKNYQLNRTDSLQSIYTANKNTYIQLPIMLRFSRGRKWRYFIDGGIFAAYWMSSQISGKIPDIFSVQTNSSQQTQSFNLVSYSQNHSFDKQADNRMEFGYAGGLGLEYAFLKQYKLFLVSRYYYGLSDQQKENIENSLFKYNQTITLVAGVKILINRNLK